MKLKKLEVTGFKSFLDKTSILFPPGISAIVGPNGCGKSNIVDALRWVMGEQSIKQLRGKSTEDLIFSGTNGTPPLNMAEVSLVLENDNGSAPEEFNAFSEIMVTRRLYRSGESNFFINKQPCRLKDIHNIFMGTGMGAKTYAVIQQGRISAITDAGPDAIRIFIEEAAGISRFKSRKREAGFKLASTNQNLIRILDIISEVKRQMNSLKRQAKKAERYNLYQDQAKQFDVHISINEFEKLSCRISETETALKDLENTEIEHTSKIKRIDAIIEDIKLKRWQKNEDISKQKSQIFETQRHVDTIENDLDHMAKDIHRLTSEIANLGHTRGDLKNKNTDIETEMADVEQDSALLGEEIISIKTLMESKQADAKRHRENLTELRETMEQQKSDLVDLLTQESQYKNIFQNASTNKENVKRRLKRVEDETVLSEKTIDTLVKEETKTEQQLQSIALEKEQLDLSIAEKRTDLNEINEQLRQQVKQSQTLDFEHNKVKSQYLTLKKMEQSFEWYKDGVRSIMQTYGPGADNDSPVTITGLMTDILEPEPSFDVAVEAALGETLQYILVEDQQAGVTLMEFLQTSGSGRSGFIPRSSIKDSQSSTKNKSESSDRLLNHVSIKPGFESIAEVLLGHVILTDTLQDAIAKWNENDLTQTIVTKGGDLITPQGIMVGGSKEQLSGILAKKQEVKRLKGQNEKLEQQLKTARQAQQEMESRVRHLEKELQQFVEAKNFTLQQETEAEKAVYRVSEDLKHARRHFEIVQLEQEQLLGEKIDIDQELSEFHKAVDEISDKIQKSQHLVAGSSTHIDVVSDKTEGLNREVVDLKLEMTGLSARLENCNQTCRRLRTFYEDGEKQLDQIGREIILKEQNIGSLKISQKESSQKLAIGYDEISGLDQKVKASESEFSAIEEKLAQNDEMISTLQGRQTQTMEQIRHLELERAEQQMKREHLVSGLEDRYQISFTEAKAVFEEQAKTISTDSDQPPQKTIPEMKDELAGLRLQIDRIGVVNLGALVEYEELKTRFDFLTTQEEDLVKAVDDLHKVIKKIDNTTKEKFITTFTQINEKLKEVIPKLFEGGSAELVLQEPDNVLESGVEFMVHPPGKKLTRMTLLSGGEKALSAISLIFSIFLLKPTSFCLMDEIDAPLDDVNVFRFNDLLKVIGEKSQVILITHNKKSMEFADKLFGITMEQKGISKVVSVNLNRT